METENGWTVRDGQEIISGDNRLIAQVHAGHAKERAAYARLIAAAPRMAEACAAALGIIECVVLLEGRKNAFGEESLDSKIERQLRALLAEIALPQADREEDR